MQVFQALDNAALSDLNLGLLKSSAAMGQVFLSFSIFPYYDCTHKRKTTPSQKNPSTLD